MTNQNEKIIYVQIDSASTGLWVPSELGDYLANTSYDEYNLPNSLLDRFKIWERWYNTFDQEIPSGHPKLDWKLFDAYGLSLAVDLKRHLGDQYQIFYGPYKKAVEIVFTTAKNGESVAVVSA